MINKTHKNKVEEENIIEVKRNKTKKKAQNIFHIH